MVREVKKDGFYLVEEGIDDPIGEPLDQRFFILLDFQKAETLPHGICETDSYDREVNQEVIKVCIH